MPATLTWHAQSAEEFLFGGNPFNNTSFPDFNFPTNLSVALRSPLATDDYSLLVALRNDDVSLSLLNVTTPTS